MLGALAVAMLLGIGPAGAQQNTETEGHAAVMSALRKKILDTLDPYVPPSNLDENGTRVSTQFRLFKAPNPNPRTLTPTLTPGSPVRWPNLDPNPNPNPNPNPYPRTLTPITRRLHAPRGRHRYGRWAGGAEA